MSNTDDENVQKISRMLEIGGTMLAQHCGNCGAPLFRYQGRVLCPVCDDVRDPRGGMQPQSAPAVPPKQKTEVSPVEIKESPVAAVPKSTPSIPPHEETSLDQSSSIPASIPELETLLIRKMVSLASAMQDETDVRRISDYLDMIERCMDIMNKMN
ncbi:Sjogren's syndrome/scleroderma autoantigen 1 family protein [Methanolobus sediminis]|uniref:Sjogren's syndrome/scleroderma autoantigen 1 family protein n=1 Tax=Methanolobus sediminis TaxID=3072978 RepID=A0AA51UMT2_9EURY|nr:Sjogren's syndrome/scleroderma autoantigen 1 family protein [Methanolobus sediminis]WMW26132.1 Sjogren's syndrome/scleroderma autoantigen 1 family protein [Methanolobus sediminis]